MTPTKKPHLLLALLISACFITSCGEMNKANRLIEDSNNAVKESEKFAEEANEKLKELDRRREEFPGTVKGWFLKTHRALDKAAQNFQAAMN